MGSFFYLPMGVGAWFALTSLGKSLWAKNYRENVKLIAQLSDPIPDRKKTCRIYADFYGDFGRIISGKIIGMEIA